MQNMMFTCVFMCQEDIPLNKIERLMSLLEKLKVGLLPADTSGVSYRNDSAALSFAQCIAQYLHPELVEKIKRSPVLGMESPTPRYQY
jgi:hypothetical protein